MLARESGDGGALAENIDPLNPISASQVALIGELHASAISQSDIWASIISRAASTRAWISRLCGGNPVAVRNAYEK